MTDEYDQEKFRQWFKAWRKNVKMPASESDEARSAAWEVWTLKNMELAALRLALLQDRERCAEECIDYLCAKRIRALPDPCDLTEAREMVRKAKLYDDSSAITRSRSDPDKIALGPAQPVAQPEPVAVYDIKPGEMVRRIRWLSDWRPGLGDKLYAARQASEEGK